MKRALLLSAILAIPWAGLLRAGTDADRNLLREISAIRAVDVHAHAEPAGAGLEEARDMEAYLDSLGSQDPAMWRVDPHHPDYILAWQELYGYAFRDSSRENVLRLLEAKKDRIRRQGDGYPSWVLDRSLIETQLVFTPTNGPFALGRGQTSPRFRWVPRADVLVFPFDKGRKGLEVLLGQPGALRLPPTLEEYETRIVIPTLVRWKNEGAVAVKLGIAYWRRLDVLNVAESDARSTYGRYAQGELPAATEYKALQDYLVRVIAREAGRTGLVVCIHTGMGAGDYFDISGSSPSLLEGMFNDPSLRGTQFVMVHGGWPYDKEAGAMLKKPNVYADFSVQMLLRSTAAVGSTLRSWLEWAPEKVMFGTDAYSDPSTPLASWEEKTWVAARAGREALTVALTGMIEDGELTRDQALLIARMVLRENALGLFHLQKEPPS